MSKHQAFQPDLLDWTPPAPRLGHHFDGTSFEEKRDGPRLGAQMQRVFNIMLDGKEHFLKEISERTGDPEGSVSARIRDLRKGEVLGATVNTRFIARGLHGYTLVLSSIRDR